MTEFLGHFLTAYDDEIVAYVSAALLAFLGYLAKRIGAAVTAYLATRQETFVAQTVVIARRILEETMERALKTQATPALAATYVVRTIPDTVKALGATHEGLVERAHAQAAEKGAATAKPA